VKLYAAVDLGATNVRVAVGDERGFRGKLIEAIDVQNGADGITAQIARMIETLDVEELDAIGVGSIGPLDLASGRVINTPNLPFKDIPIIEPLSNALGVPVKLLNDCSAAVLGEHSYGAGRGLRNLVYITLSTGLGGGAIVDGHLLTGKDGNAHEVGHLTIDPCSELVCGCGCRGHWEAYCSGANIPNFARMLLKGAKGNVPIKPSTVERSFTTSEALFSAANQGDPLALWIVERIGEVNAIGFADAVNVYDPELITVGGSIALRNEALILDPIRKNIGRHLINRKPEIMITPLGDEAVLFGALALAKKE